MRSTPSRAERWIRSRWAMALPALAICVLWWPSLGSQFQFDDWNVIVNNPRVHSLAAWWQSMPGIRPLLKLSYALNFAVSEHPAGFRLVNVLIHATNAVLVCWLLRERGRRIGLTQGRAAFAALVAASLFALHPVQTEAVTYISGRSSSLMALFCLLSLYCWARSLNSEHGPHAVRWLIGCGLAFIAAAAAKEVALALPLALWLYSADLPVRDTLRRLSPVLMLAVLMAVIACLFPTYRHLLQVSLDTRPIGTNLLTQAHALVYLCGQLLRIHHANADPQLPVVEHADLASIILCVTWAAALVLALSNVRRAPVIAFAVLWFLLWLAPTNSLLPRLDVANDRQLYLALIGPAWALGIGISAWRLHPHWLTYAGAVLLLALLAHATVLRNRVYVTEISFWQDTAGRNPYSARAHNNLGMAYALECRIDEAAGEFRRSIDLDPQDYRARINLRLLGQGALPGVDMQRCAGIAR